SCAEGASAAYRALATTPVQGHAAFIRRVAELHRKRREVLADIIVREMDKPILCKYCLSRGSLRSRRATGETRRNRRQPASSVGRLSSHTAPTGQPTTV